MKRNERWGLALCLLGLAFMMVASSAAAQGDANVAGTWALTMAPMQGGGGGGQGGGGGAPPPQTLTLTQDGTKVSGTLAGGRGGDAPVTGSVSGNTLTFSVTRQGRDGNSMTLNYSATVSGDTMTGKMTGGRGDREFTAKKQ
jgi:hypothetical protein